VIQGWSQEKILAALHGYKDGTYGGAMKGIMKGQALKLDDAQMKALAQYISKL
jgi:cytochrome c553